MTLHDILKQLDLPIQGEDKPIDGIHTLENASPSQLSYAMAAKFGEALKATQAAAVFIPEAMKELVPSGCEGIVVENPELSMAYASRLFKKELVLPEKNAQIDETARIFEGAHMGTNVVVGPYAVIMPGVYLGDNVTVGAYTVLHPNTVIYHDCRIGDRCIIHANTVIGSDGFGYAHTRQGEHIKIEQMGNVVIGDDVEIGSNTSIDRAAFSSTLIKAGSKIDNLVHISHNVEVGERTIIAGQAGIAGSTKIGKNVVMAAQSGSVGHITIADFTTVAARGGITKNTEPGKTYAGFPHMEHKQWLKLQAILSRLLKR